MGHTLLKLRALWNLAKQDTCPPELEKHWQESLSLQLERLGMPADSVRLMVREAIHECKEAGKREGTCFFFGEAHGEFMLLDAAHGKSPAAEIVSAARQDHATDDDIREWWSQYDLVRRMILHSEEVFRFSVFSEASESLSPEEAMARVRSMFPMYGDPSDRRHVSGDDRLLPQELRSRVDRYREKHGAAECEARAKQFTTYNALIRAEIRAGRL
jgi:hypothetical protein